MPLAKLFCFFLVLISLTANAEESVDCESAWTTRDINHCLYQDLQSADTQMATYLAAALKRYNHDEASMTAINHSQDQWLTYRDAHCDAVYTVWREGTIRGAMALACRIELSEQRTAEIWQAYLTYMDSSEPILPQPVFNRKESY